PDAAAEAVDTWWRRVSADTAARGRAVALLVDSLVREAHARSGGYSGNTSTRVSAGRDCRPAVPDGRSVPASIGVERR
ncbi:hypothetical protein ACWDSE_25605, partial [Micromonospora chersina]